MRCWYLLLGVLMVMIIAGCGGVENTATVPTVSMLTFRYDAARDVVLVNTSPFMIAQPSEVPPYAVIASTQPPVEPLPPDGPRYAAALAGLPAASYAPAPNIRLTNPQTTVTDGVLTVNYLTAAGLEQLASAQANQVLAALEAWLWVPGIRQVIIQAQGTPLTRVGPVVVTQPLTPSFHTYTIHSETREVAYMVGSLQPRSIEEAAAILTQRTMRELPASKGFVPLLPLDTTLTVDPTKLSDGVLPVNLSANFSRAEQLRLGALVMTFTQFPNVTAVRFTFGGQTVNENFMRSNLTFPIYPYDLLLTVAAAEVTDASVLRSLQSATTATLQHTPASYGTARAWGDWACITAVMEQGAAPQAFVLKKSPEGYAVIASGPAVTGELLLKQGMSRDALIALRLPGWETLALPEKHPE
ncbi:MAG: GerMN domain-containing protein [Armatimonadota bacterium]